LGSGYKRVPPIQTRDSASIQQRAVTEEMLEEERKRKKLRIEQKLEKHKLAKRKMQQLAQYNNFSTPVNRPVPNPDFGNISQINEPSAKKLKNELVSKKLNFDAAELLQPSIRTKNMDLPVRVGLGEKGVGDARPIEIPKTTKHNRWSSIIKDTEEGHSIQNNSGGMDVSFDGSDIPSSSNVTLETSSMNRADSSKDDSIDIANSSIDMPSENDSLGMAPLLKNMAESMIKEIKKPMENILKGPDRSQLKRTGSEDDLATRRPRSKSPKISSKTPKSPSRLVRNLSNIGRRLRSRSRLVKPLRYRDPNFTK